MSEGPGVLPRLQPGWLDSKPVQRVFEAMKAEGETTRIVGGAVRNAILDEPVGDIDFATTLPPEEVMTRARAARIKVVPTGIDHGTVMLVTGGRAFEVTTLRLDIETFGRHARVAFGRDWEEDARRRDFTMNALYLARDGTVSDPVGGYEDVRARHVRFIGEARQRIREDGLRILRFFRFAAAYGEGRLDGEGMHACILERALLGRLSRERVRQEMVKLLVARDAVSVVRAMAEAGFLTRVTGAVPRLRVFEALAGIEADMGVAPEAMRRLAALCCVVADDAERLAERFRLSAQEKRRLCMAAPRRSPPADAKAVRESLYRAGRDATIDQLLLAFARGDGKKSDDRLVSRVRLALDAPVPAFPFSGGDAVALGLAPGPAVGRALRRFEAWWIAQDFPEEEGALRDALRRAVSQAAGKD